MPAEKLTIQSGQTTPVLDEKNNDRIMTTSDDSIQRVADQFSSSSLTVSKSGGDHHSECPECNGEYESCQHWTQVGRSFSSRHGQRKKVKNVPNGHMEDVRTVPTRSAREQMMSHRPTNGEPHTRMGLRGSTEFSSSNVNRTRPERTTTHVAEFNKVNRSDNSSPSPSVPSPDMRNDYETYDNRSFHRHSMRLRRSFRSGNSHIESGELTNNIHNTTSHNADLNNPAPINRPPFNRGSSNTSQSSGAQGNYRNGPGDNWRRPLNGTFRRSHQTISYGSRNHNSSYRSNVSGPHPPRTVSNGFGRNRGQRTTETGDPPNQPQHLNPSDSSSSIPTVVSPTKSATSTQEMKTSWAAAVAAPVRAGTTKYEDPPNSNHQQLVNFLVNQWHSFQQKSP